MRNKETGEFELLVGDRQLLSGFFIGVLLLAAVFAMGYVLGQNSPHAAKLETASTSAPVITQSPAASRPQAASPPVMNPEVNQAAAADQAGANPPVDAPPQPTTQPARETAAPVAAPPPPGPAPETGGTFWQVSSLSNRTSAFNVLESLKDKGLPASLRAGPNNMTLIWVGPYSDKELSKAKIQLEKLGFTGLMKKQ